MRAGFLRGRRRWLAIAAGLLAVYTVAGFFVVPPVVRSQIVGLARTKLHREAVIARVSFNPFTLGGALEGLDLRDRDGVALFRVDRLTGNLEISGIFRRAWRFREISVDGPALHARILGDGKPSFADLLQRRAEPREKPRLPRLIVDRFRLRGGQVEFVDESRSPRFVQVFEPLELDLHDLITIPAESGDHAVTIGLGKESTLRWSGAQTVEPLHLEGRVEIAGLTLGRLWEYARPNHALAVAEGRADVALSYDIRQAADGPLVVELNEASLRARGVAVGPRGGAETWLELPAVEASGVEVTWPESRIRVAAVQVTDPRIVVRRNPEGQVNWAAARPGAPAEPTRKPWAAAIGELTVTGGEITVDDAAADPDVKTIFSGVDVRLQELSTDPSAPVTARIAATINGSGQASLSGTVVRAPLSADLEAAIRDLDLTPFEPYVVRFPGADFRHGDATLTGRLRVSPSSPRLQFQGAGAVKALQVAGAGEDRLVAWQEARARGVQVALVPHHVRIGEIQVDGAFLKLRIDGEGKVNLSALGRRASPSERTAREPVPVDIGKIVFRDATADYTDESLILPFGTKIHSVHGDLRDLSSIAAAPARLALEGRVGDTGFVKVEGVLRVSDPFALADIDVDFHDVNMPDLTPYTAHFAGYSVQRGVLDVDVHYRVQDRHLLGDHRVIAKDLVLGPKVEGAKGPGLPVRLAVALLKDKEGRIDLEVPIEGTVDAPEFSYRGVVWQAFKTILANIATAPFRAIGRLLGRDEEDLELVGFVSGRSDLPPPEQEKLTQMAAELGRRSEISLEIEGRFDPVRDAEALRRARLEARIDARRAPDANIDSILETLYRETFSQEQLDAQRLAFMPTPEVAAPTPAPGRKARRKPLPPPTPPPREAFDATAFYDSLRTQLIEAETVEQSDLSRLARDRASAIAAALTAPGGLDPSRVRSLVPSPVKKKKKQASDLVASEMTLTAED